MRVAFFQRFFAHYQWGLVQELSDNSRHEYTFFGDTGDPAHSGIAAIPQSRLADRHYRAVRTWQPNRVVAVQPATVFTALLGKYDAIVLEGAYLQPTGWAAMWMARARGKRVLLYGHGWRRPDANMVIRQARLTFMKQADASILYGYRAKRIGASLGIAAAKMHVAFNALDYREMKRWRDAVSEADRSATRERLFGNPEIPIVVYTGRLTREKQVALLLEACARLVSLGHQLGLLVVGDGPELGRLKATAETLSLPAFFHGPLYDERELCSLISSASVAVVPAAAGLSLIHAMTYGTPVVTSDRWDWHGPEAEAVIEGKTGAFFSAGDAFSLSNTLMPFLANDGLREQYARRCTALIDRYYNPAYMREVFDRAVSGEPAIDVDIEALLDRIGDPVPGDAR